jgi:hypothetical protein
LNQRYQDISILKNKRENYDIHPSHAFSLISLLLLAKSDKQGDYFSEIFSHHTAPRVACRANLPFREGFIFLKDFNTCQVDF